MDIRWGSNTNTETHLTEELLTKYLREGNADLKPEESEHLASCLACQKKAIIADLKLPDGVWTAYSVEEKEYVMKYYGITEEDLK